MENSSINFEQIVKQHEKLIYSVCFQFTKNAQAAQDLSQDTFLAAFVHMHRCPPAQTKAWLVKIATNKAKDYLKSAYNRHILQNGKGEDELLSQKADNNTTEDIVISRQEATRLCTMVQSLKEPYLLVASMYFLQEKDVTDIAKELNRPPKTVHTQIYRAKEILKKMIKNGGEGA